MCVASVPYSRDHAHLGEIHDRLCLIGKIRVAILDEREILEIETQIRKARRCSGHLPNDRSISTIVIYGITKLRKFREEILRTSNQKKERKRERKMLNSPNILV